MFLLRNFLCPCAADSYHTWYVLRMVVRESDQSKIIVASDRLHMYIQPLFCTWYQIGLR